LTKIEIYRGERERERETKREREREMDVVCLSELRVGSIVKSGMGRGRYAVVVRQSEIERRECIRVRWGEREREREREREGGCGAGELIMSVEHRMLAPPTGRERERERERESGKLRSEECVFVRPAEREGERVNLIRVEGETLVPFECEVERVGEREVLPFQVGSIVTSEREEIEWMARRIERERESGGERGVETLLGGWIGSGLVTIGTGLEATFTLPSGLISHNSTYTAAAGDFLASLGRPVVKVNLDPGADVFLPYEADVNITALISTLDVSDAMGLGPNGALLFAFEFIAKNVEWVREGIKVAISRAHRDSPYPDESLAEFADRTIVLFDTPGQVELYTLDGALQNLISQLQAKDALNLVAIHCVDALHARDAVSLISVGTTCLAAMLKLELPHINVLSKFDVLEGVGATPSAFDLRLFLETGDFTALPGAIEEGDAATADLHTALADLLDSFGLVSLMPLSIKSKTLMYSLIAKVDETTGYIYADLDQLAEPELQQQAAGAPHAFAADRALDAAELLGSQPFPMPDEEQAYTLAVDAGVGRQREVRVCSVCAKFLAKPLRCGQCRVALYCGPACQLIGWKDGHKQECAGRRGGGGGGGGAMSS
jgi:hypothetical protein